MMTIIKALLMVGVFLVLVAPVFVMAADEADPNPSIAISEEIGTSSNQEEQPTTPPAGEVDASQSGDESSFTTTATEGGVSEETNIAISDEFTGNSTGGETTGAEGDFTTSSATPVSNPIVSAEYSFTTETTDGGSTPTEVVSGEYTFTTTTGDGGTTTEVVSSEYSFTTTTGGGGTTTEVVGDEYTFTTTTGGGGTTTEVVSDEYSFTTTPSTNPPVTPPTGGGGGCVSNCGGGGGTIIPPPIITKWVCTPYLLEYIKFGAHNNSYEVRKLQAFLIVFEKENGIKVTGFYDRATFEAVERFQMKYNRDVLGPWGISDSTGYVFITTKLAINNVYCGRDTANDLDLRNYYGRIETLIKQSEISEPIATTSWEIGTSSVEVAKGKNFLQLAFVGFLDFLRDIPCWFWNLLLLLLIIILLLIIWYLSEEDDDGDEDDTADIFGNNSKTETAISEETVVTPLPLTIEAEKEYENLPVGSQASDGEVIVLGKEEGEK
ncbi:MAG: hypothetical protein A2370_03170 [Candidatus Vogelbacteria bacterium RIFOXYB1_FULL_42_16]|uniref:Peptidoglycan binding-like domain-containing protein n=1 Tax=Candidatus Vogelbacteria bacterium RIFOXYB1_FULL_42_16 TaxID=1802436 RepID=A0A1G2QGQ9_9BACT|nr:MAG: hypothetical protein A2370_03170 [Candidatus Vogelbacteria bacterium RIFOXYB1_FULL_42_16]